MRSVLRELPCGELLLDCCLCISCSFGGFWSVVISREPCGCACLACHTVPQGCGSQESCPTPIAHRQCTDRAGVCACAEVLQSVVRSVAAQPHRHTHAMTLLLHFCLVKFFFFLLLHTAVTFGPVCLCKCLAVFQGFVSGWNP